MALIPLSSVPRRALTWWTTTWSEIESTRDPTARFGGFEAGVVLVACLGLMVPQFLGSELTFLEWALAAGLAEDWEGVRLHPWAPLGSLWFWVGTCVLGCMVLPMVYLRLTGRSLRDYNLRFSGLTAHLGVYAAMCAAVLLCVAAVSFLPDFQRIYPFYPLADRSWLDLLLWELGYAAQFVALEFFFRAFLLEGLRRCLGPGAILVMLLPYCMLHVPKTGLETAGSIIAGLVLGMMAMRWRSIWGGVLVHTTIAVSMDVASLLQQDRLPPPGWLP